MRVRYATYAGRAALPQVLVHHGVEDVLAAVQRPHGHAARVQHCRVPARQALALLLVQRHAAAGRAAAGRAAQHPELVVEVLAVSARRPAQRGACKNLVFFFTENFSSKCDSAVMLADCE